MEMVFEIQEYITAAGRKPFTEWINGLRDKAARAKLSNRLSRAVKGNFGDWKALDGGLYEMREHYGPGYRIFYALVGNKIVLLLGGSTKRDQEREIAKAKRYYADYQNRPKNPTE
jgi:putative addiction module killer protein